MAKSRRLGMISRDQNTPNPLDFQSGSLIILSCACERPDYADPRPCGFTRKPDADIATASGNQHPKPGQAAQRAGLAVTAFSRVRHWLTNRFRAFGHAGRGILVLLGTPHGRIHAAATAAVSLLGLGLGISATDWALLLICFALVLVAEAINTAVECVVDIVSPQRQPLARDAKDLAAGGVLIAAVVAAAVGVIVFLPYLQVITTRLPPV